MNSTIMENKTPGRNKKDARQWDNANYAQQQIMYIVKLLFRPIMINELDLVNEKLI